MTPDPVAGHRGADWTVDAIGATCAVSLAATAFDSALLHYRRAYFTGGFLAQNYITRPLEAVGFLVGSLLADAAVAAVIVTLMLWMAGRFAVPRRLALAVVFICAGAPMVYSDFIAYRLMTYLGDAFDLGLMFDLAGRNPRELLAVSAAHLTKLAAAGLGVAVLGLAGLFFLVRKREPVHGVVVPRASFWRAAAIAAAFLAAGVVSTTALRVSSDVLDNGLQRTPAGRFLGVAVATLSDLDRDGAGILGRPEDPDLFDARIRPYAVDIPGNGIDEDGVGGDLPVGIEAYREGAEPSAPWRSKPDVVLIVLESFRADTVGVRSGGQAVTPVLDALAARGLSAKYAYSHNGYTVQSRRHIFTGSTADIRGETTLIDDFKAQGYETAYFSAQDESFGGVAQGIGFERADVHYDARVDPERRFSTFSTAGSLVLPFNVIVEKVHAFLTSRRTDRPLFLYVNFEDSHFPYHHAGIHPILNGVVLPQQEIAPAHSAALREMYLNTVANVDRAIGEVLSTAQDSLGREPGVIVMSDHGESLYDESFLGHGYALNDVQTRIPLIVAGLPLMIEQPFGQADLRDAIHAALEGAQPSSPVPRDEEDPSRRIFQYLGLIQRPAQIALTGMHGRVIYDFREGKVRIGDADWRRPDSLAPNEQSAFLDVVHTWERMMLARSAASEAN